MIVRLYYKGNEYDLTPYIDLTDNSRSDTIEEQLDSGKIVLSRVSKDIFSELDMSKRVPSLCKLYFNNEKGIERYYLTADTQCFEIIKGKRWKHEIGLIELTKELQLTPIRDMTITQPQDGNYYSASSARTDLYISGAKKSTIYLNAYDTGLITENPFVFGKNDGINTGKELTTSMQEIQFDILNQTNADIIDFMTIKENGEYNIALNADIINPMVAASGERSYGTFGLEWGRVRSFGKVATLKLYLQKNAGALEEIYNSQISPTAITSNIELTSNFPALKFYTNLSSQNISINKKITITETTSIKIYARFETDGNWDFEHRYKRVFSEDNYIESVTPRLYIGDMNVNIYKESDAELEDPELPIRLGQTVQKIVRLSGIDLVVSESTLARLNTYGTPENTFTKFTAWDALKEIGATVGAIPEIIINENGDKELVFNYYSDMETDYVVIEPPNVQSIASARNLDNYVGGLQLNADNIVSSNLSETIPYNKNYEANTGDVEIQTDWMTLRAGSDGNVKITTDNIGIRLPNRIYQIRQVEIKGLDLNAMTGGVLPYNADYIWKLNEDEDQLRILEEKYWQTLEDSNDYTLLTSRIATKKNNTIYYRQGDYRIYGMNFTAQFKPMIETDPDKTEGNRSIYEMLFVKAIIKSGITQIQLNSILNVLKDPGTVAEDNKLKFRITYIPQDYSRATIYKEDLSGFEMPNVEKYYNETAIINDPLSLGVNAQDTINRLGNTVISYVGYAKPNEQLPFIGSKTADNKILTSITYNDRPYRTDYVASYVQDFSIISDYVGVKSPHRQYQIPNEGIVLALDKNKTHIFVDTQPIVSTPTVWGNNIKEFFDLKATKSKAPLFAEISTYLFDTDYNANTADGLFIRPLTKTPTGRTINFKYQMDSNFSAGATKKKTSIGGQDVYWQEEVPYTTKFGRLYGAKVRLVKDVNKNAIIADPTVEDKYPILDENVVTETYTDNKYVVDKDAREIMALSEEVAFHSNKVNEIILYDGITKFNPMTLTDLSRNNIKIAVMNNNYKISKSAKKVDYAGLQSVGGSILNGITYTLFDNRIEFNLPAEAHGKGLVIYNDNVDSGDLVMIYLTEVNGSETKTLYFGTKKLGE
jgi:hypothetical protein